MDKKKAFILLFIIFFIFACEKIKGEQEGNPVEAKEETVKVNPQEQTNTDNIITLKAEAVKEAGLNIETVSLRPLKVEYAFSGKVDINETRLSHVGSRMQGRAVAVYANLGDYIKNGDILATIDSLELGEAQNQYLKTVSNLQFAEKSYERATMLILGKVISTGEFQKREAEYYSAKAEARAAEDRLHLLGMTDEDVQSIGKNHTINSKVPIYSPMEGTVIERHLTIGEMVEPVKPLFIIADLSTLWVIADIPEKDISKIKEGQEVRVTVSPYPEKVFRGKINYISDILDQETRAVKVGALVENPALNKGKTERILKPGMFAVIKISAGKKDVLSIPSSAVQREGEKTIVFIAIDDNSFEKRGVELSPSLEGFHEVLSGVKKGERVVEKGSFTLKSEGLKGLMEEE